MPFILLILVLVFIFTITSCSDRKNDRKNDEKVVYTLKETDMYETYIPEKNREKYSQFIVNTTAAFMNNNHNQIEDPEEIIVEARRAADKIFGIRKMELCIERSYICESISNLTMQQVITQDSLIKIMEETMVR